MRAAYVYVLEHRCNVAEGEAKIASRVLLGRPKGAPLSFRRTGLEEDAQERESGLQMAPKWELKSQGWWYFFLFSALFAHICFCMNA